MPKARAIACGLQFYEPSFAAKSLRTRSVSKFLVTVPDITNRFFASVIQLRYAGDERATTSSLPARRWIICTLGGLRPVIFRWKQARVRTRALMTADERPTVVFCFSDEMAIGALSAIRACGLECARDVSVLGERKSILNLLMLSKPGGR